ncbi:biotin--[acetyl-CoA-carboxylase] ligase [Salana multivorans]
MAAPTGFTRLVVVDETGSTNDDLLAARTADPAAWPHLAALRACHQSAGHGRLGRTWTTPPGKALTISVVVEPGDRPREEWPGLSLVAGLAALRACERLAPGLDVALKWPNDVVVRLDAADRLATNDDDPAGWAGLRKLGGVLAQAGGDAVVLGIGVNVGQLELPVPWATSLALAAPEGTSRLDPAELADALGEELAPLLTRWLPGGFAAVREEIMARLDTIGRVVEVDRGAGTVLDGVAVDLDTGGRLVVEEETGTRHAVAAGDVRHLRATR